MIFSLVIKSENRVCALDWLEWVERLQISVICTFLHNFFYSRFFGDVAQWFFPILSFFLNLLSFGISLIFSVFHLFYIFFKILKLIYFSAYSFSNKIFGRDFVCYIQKKFLTLLWGLNHANEKKKFKRSQRATLIF